MKPRLWLLLSLLLLCGFLGTTAAVTFARVAAPTSSRSHSDFPLMDQVGLIHQNASLCASAESESDHSDLHPALFRRCSATDLCFADSSLWLHCQGAYSNVLSLVTQGVRLQI